MIYPVLISNTREIIHCSNLHSTDDPILSNLCLDLFDGEKASSDFVKSLREVNQDQNIMLIGSEDIIGCTFLTEPFDNEEQHQTSIVKCIGEHRDTMKTNPDYIRSLFYQQ